MAIKIQTTRDQHTDGIKCVLYGMSGVGKTRLCTTAPKPIILSAERGLLSLAGFDMPFIEINTMQDLDEAYKHTAKSAEYETICIDSLSEISETVVANFRKEVADGRQAYMKLSEAMGAMIRNFRNLKNKNVVFIAKQRRVDDDESGTVTFEPYLPGRVLPFQLPYLVDEVFCMRIDNKGNRYIQTNADRKYTCKDRSGKLSAIEQPDLTAIFNKIVKVKQDGPAS